MRKPLRQKKRSTPVHPKRDKTECQCQMGPQNQQDGHPSEHIKLADSLHCQEPLIAVSLSTAAGMHRVAAVAFLLDRESGYTLAKIPVFTEQNTGGLSILVL